LPASAKRQATVQRFALASSERDSENMSDTNETMATAAPAVDPAELEKLQKLAAERDQYLDMAQRARAEFENYQKRVQKDRDLERRYAYTPLIFDLLPVFDNLERTLHAAQQAG